MSSSENVVPGLVEPGDLFPTEDESLVYEPIARLVKNPEPGSNKLVKHTLQQYQDEAAYCASKLAVMAAKGWDLRVEANSKLHRINKERRKNGYPAILAWVFEDDMSGVWPVRYLVEDGTRSMLPYCNDFPDTFIFERLFKLKLILPDPFTEAHKTTDFCAIWGYNEDEYINRYHRWLAEIDLLTEGVEETTEVSSELSSESSTGSDLVNMGGVNLRKLERLIDNGASSPDSSLLESSSPGSSSPGSSSGSSGGIVFDYDCSGSDGIEDGKPAAAGSPRLNVEKLAQLDDEICEILMRPCKWGIMTQLPAEDEDNTAAAKTDTANEESEEEESPKKKQKTSDNEEATIDGQESGGDDSETDQVPSGVEILCTGSFSY
ncbi:hypothetical protein SEMRO_572_G168860.1 [Seminavis robusta]|uniref:Uncharacterized protein n=1 Tax=Seminavis robusta TaxID=568900 RepID=A0A9N8HI50_9STRA|nr:hypothetical protein SEMRO_572_G168860.1 [Seminavis robusta]|eukprot:Sro572_g168860.1 n/a (377) ;mRNA; r:47903-49033